MPLVCPICKTPAQELPGTGEVTGFRCVIHNNFKVADAVLRRAEEYTREQWEIALRKAKQRAWGNGPLSEEAISDFGQASQTDVDPTVIAPAAKLECLLKEPKSKNYQDGKNKEDDRRNPIASGRSVCVHGTIPLKTFVTLLTAIAHAVCHTDVTFR